MTSTTIYYIVYKTTNNVNGKIYIGVHKTSNLNDSYLGSGTAIKSAIKLYGTDNFTREILSIHDSYDGALNHERELVNEDFLKQDNVYNLTVGGGMPPNATGRIIKDTVNYSIENKKRWSNPEYRAKTSANMKGRIMSEEQKLQLSLSRKGISTGSRSSATILKISEAQQKIYTFQNETDTFIGTYKEFALMMNVNKQSIIASISKRGKYKGWVRL